jgi:hypothetical protein
MRHHVGFAVLIPHAREDDEDRLEREGPPAHHPSADEPLDDRGHLKLLLAKAEIEVQYYRACLRGDEQSASEANDRWQEIDRRLSKSAKDEDDDDHERHMDEDEDYVG